MPKASISLSTGAIVTIEGAQDEISQLLDWYDNQGATKPQPAAVAKSLPGRGLITAYALLVVLCLMAITVAGFLNLRIVGQGAQELYFQVTLPYSYLAQAHARLGELLGHMSEFAYIPDTQAASRMAAEEDINEIEYQMGLYRTSYLTAEEQALLRQFDQTWAAYREGAGKLFDQIGGGDAGVVAELQAQSQTAGQAVEATFVGASELKLRQAENYRQRGLDQAKSATFGLLATSAFCILLVAILSALIIRQAR